MSRIRVVGALLLGAGFLVGCNTGNVSGPRASAPIATDPQTAAGLQRSWEATHPGSRAGVVDAVLPARRLASVSNLPINEIPDGTVLSILDDRQNALVSGVVVAHHGSDVHIRYNALASGERDPRIGDLAVWFPGGPAVPPESVQPGPPMEAPTTAPSQDLTVPATQPAENPAAPTTERTTGNPTSGGPANANEPANANGAAGNTGTSGGTAQPTDLNK